jgi:hypothetical protein
VTVVAHSDVGVDVFQLDRALDHKMAGCDNSDGRLFLGIKLVLDLAYHFFDQVFKRYQA